MKLTREGIAYRLACDLTEGCYVNLGVGIPCLVPAFLPADREIFIHNENGTLGIGPVAAAGKEDPDLVSANREYVTLVPGASVFDHAASFGMIIGGHLTHAVLGAMEVAANGDMANWHVPGQKVPGVGGAMDLAIGAQNLWIAMTHVNNKGEPKILAKCTCPLTAPRCVRRIYTDIAVIDVTPGGLVLREVMQGLDPVAVQTQTGAPLSVAQDWRQMDVPDTHNGVRLIA
jgi:3-oxoacid CoA-transferase subunit B